MKWNINFCLKQKNGIEYCYDKCNKRCPTIINLWYGYIINPLTLLWLAMKNKFTKCDKLPTSCSFLFCKKYCCLKNKCR
jgi:hypothetical protein